jgi:hypothetical protein
MFPEHAVTIEEKESMNRTPKLLSQGSQLHICLTWITSNIVSLSAAT